MLRAAPAGPQEAEQGHAAALAHARRRVGPTAARLRRGRQADRLMVTRRKKDAVRMGCRCGEVVRQRPSPSLSEGGLKYNFTVLCHSPHTPQTTQSTHHSRRHQPTPAPQGHARHCPPWATAPHSHTSPPPGRCWLGVRGRPRRRSFSKCNNLEKREV